MSRTHTARAARYDVDTLTVRDHGPRDMAVHHVMTRHGAVRRTWLPGPLLVEVGLWRPGNAEPQYQGQITRANGRYVATTSRGEVVARCADYTDAEAALLPLRLRTRSAARGHWPVEILTALARMREPAPTCANCGHRLTGGICTRPDLHW